MITWAFGGRGGLADQVNNVIVWPVFAILGMGPALAATTKNNELQRKLVADSVIAMLFALAFMPLTWVGTDFSLSTLQKWGFGFLPSYPIHFALSAFAVPSTLGIYAWYAIKLRWPTQERRIERAGDRPPYVSATTIPSFSFGFILQ